MASTDTTDASQGDAASGTEQKRAPRVIWNDEDMRTTYANAVNAVSTLEEVAIFFGVNKRWNPGEGDLEVDLSDRMVLNPHAAKRLWTILGAVLNEYENRFGPLNVVQPPAASPPKSDT